MFITMFSTMDNTYLVGFIDVGGLLMVVCDPLDKKLCGNKWVPVLWLGNIRTGVLSLCT